MPSIHRLRREFLSILDELGADEATRVIIVTGTGRAFCASADVSTFEETNCELEGPCSRIDDMPREIYVSLKSPLLAPSMGLRPVMVLNGCWASI